MQYTIVDDYVEVAPIYRCDGKDPQPTRPHENHSLAMEHLPTWPESQCKQQSKSLVVPVQGSLEKSSKIQTCLFFPNKILALLRSNAYIIEILFTTVYFYELIIMIILIYNHHLNINTLPCKSH